MSAYPNWDTDRYPHTSDYILQLFRANYEPPEVYRAVSKHFLLKTRPRDNLWLMKLRHCTHATCLRPCLFQLMIAVSYCVKFQGWNIGKLTPEEA